MRAITNSFCVVILALTLAPEAHAQRDKFLRTNPKFIETFREVVAKPSVSTVRIVCDGKDTALGIIVGADGWVLTKANDLKMPIVCRLKDKREFPATVAGVHKGHDLAMLKIDATDLVPVVFTPSKGVDAGSWVACAGVNEDPVAVGVVSVSTRTVINKGPAYTIDNTKAGFLGIVLKDGEDGVFIEDVQVNSPASEAGLKADDVILALGQKTVKDVETFMTEMAKTRPGDVVTLKIRRDEEDREVKATLRKRPANMSRGDFQNKMGSELSTRRSGYGTILQHDSVVKPVDCGGPIVDLEGRVIGINICRAGRTESWAVPSEVLETVVADLKSGKLAPPEDFARGRPEDAKAPIDALVDLMKQRLDIAADLARYRFANKTAKAEDKDASQLAMLVLAAEELGLDQNLLRDFFMAQFTAARKLQEELHARWSKDETSLSTAGLPTFEITLRRKIDRLSIDMLSAYARAEPFLREMSIQHMLRERSAQVLQSEAISDAVRDRALRGWLLPK
jgi:serine protease Do